MQLASCNSTIIQTILLREQVHNTIATTYPLRCSYPFVQAFVDPHSQRTKLINTLVWTQRGKASTPITIKHPKQKQHVKQDSHDVVPYNLHNYTLYYVYNATLYTTGKDDPSQFMSRVMLIVVLGEASIPR